jgi:hypothetical protein
VGLCASCRLCGPLRQLHHCCTIAYYVYTLAILLVRCCGFVARQYWLHSPCYTRLLAPLRPQFVVLPNVPALVLLSCPFFPQLCPLGRSSTMAVRLLFMSCALGTIYRSHRACVVEDVLWYVSAFCIPCPYAHILVVLVSLVLAARCGLHHGFLSHNAAPVPSTSPHQRVTTRAKGTGWAVYASTMKWGRTVCPRRDTTRGMGRSSVLCAAPVHVLWCRSYRLGATRLYRWGTLAGHEHWSAPPPTLCTAGWYSRAWLPTDDHPCWPDHTLCSACCEYLPLVALPVSRCAMRADMLYCRVHGSGLLCLTYVTVSPAATLIPQSHVLYVRVVGAHLPLFYHPGAPIRRMGRRDGYNKQSSVVVLFLGGACRFIVRFHHPLCYGIIAVVCCFVAPFSMGTVLHGNVYAFLLVPHCCFLDFFLLLMTCMPLHCRCHLLLFGCRSSW